MGASYSTSRDENTADVWSIIRRFRRNSMLGILTFYKKRPHCSTRGVTCVTQDDQQIVFDVPDNLMGAATVHYLTSHGNAKEDVIILGGRC